MSNALFKQLLCCRPCPVIPPLCSPLFAACAGSGGAISFTGNIVATFVNRNVFNPTLIETVDEFFITFSAGGTTSPNTTAIDVSAGTTTIRRVRVSWNTEYDDNGNPSNYECQRIVDEYDPYGFGIVYCTGGNPPFTVEDWQSIVFTLGNPNSGLNCTRTVTPLSSDPNNVCFGQPYSQRIYGGIFFADFSPQRTPNTISAPAGCELQSVNDPGTYLLKFSDIPNFGPDSQIPWGFYNYNDGIFSITADGLLQLRLT